MLRWIAAGVAGIAIAGAAYAFYGSEIRSAFASIAGVGGAREAAGDPAPASPQPRPDFAARFTNDHRFNGGFVYVDSVQFDGRYARARSCQRLLEGGGQLAMPRELEGYGCISADTYETLVQEMNAERQDARGE